MLTLNGEYQYWCFNGLGYSRNGEICINPSRYVIVDADSGTAATVDAAWDVAGVLRFVEGLGATVTAALYTHRHEDHVGGRSPTSGSLRAGAMDMASAGATVFCMDADADSVEQSTETVVTRLVDGGIVPLGAHTITAIATPTHTPTKWCFLAGTAGGTVESEVVFTGDTLFVGGFGRMSLEAGTGDVGAMFSSLARLAQLGGGTAVLAGHHFGAQRISNIGDEMRHNAAYRCATAAQLAALAGIAPGGPIRMNPAAGSAVTSSILDGLDFSGVLVPNALANAPPVLVLQPDGRGSTPAPRYDSRRVLLRRPQRFPCSGHGD